jgi:hypothetical protein
VVIFYIVRPAMLRVACANRSEGSILMAAPINLLRPYSTTVVHSLGCCVALEIVVQTIESKYTRVKPNQQPPFLLPIGSQKPRQPRSTTYCTFCTETSIQSSIRKYYEWLREAAQHNVQCTVRALILACSTSSV